MHVPKLARDESMKIAKVVLLIPIVFLILSSCTTVQDISTKTKDIFTRHGVTRVKGKAYSPTNPHFVVLTTVKVITRPYEVIGHVSVKRYNLVGIKRQQGVIDDLMKEDASKIGGNAIVNIKKTMKTEIGDVIRFNSA